MVVSSSKGFRVELGTLVLFEANTLAGTRLEYTTFTDVFQFFNEYIAVGSIGCNSVVPGLDRAGTV